MIQEIIGYVAGAFIVFSFVPQVIKSYRTKSVNDLSFWMVLATFVGTILWIVYGYMRKDMPLLVINIVFGFIVLFQLFLKIKYEK